MDLRRGSQGAVDPVVEFLSNHACTVTTTAEIAQVATISANGDHHERVITVKEGRTIKDEIEITEGVRFDRGFISPYFVTDVKGQKIECKEPLILLREKRISCLTDNLPCLRAAAHKALCSSSLGASVASSTSSVAISIAAVKAPSFGDKHKSILGDLAILTGGTVFTDGLKVKLERASEDTIVLNGEGSKDAIQAHCEQNRSLVADTTRSEYDRTKLQERFSELSGGVAVIKVGEKQDRYDDALNATRAIVEEEDILPGRGVALLKAVLQLAKTSPAASSSSISSPVDASAKPMRGF